MLSRVVAGVRRRPLFVLCAIVGPFALLAAACGSNASSAPAGEALTPIPPALLATLQPPTPRAGAQSVASGPAVSIDNFNFTPATITVPAGATITWVNHDDVPHTVTASDNAYTSQPIDSDGQFQHTYTIAGTYSYYCAIHPFMTAKVVVQ